MHWVLTTILKVQSLLYGEFPLKGFFCKFIWKVLGTTLATYAIQVRELKNNQPKQNKK